MVRKYRKAPVRITNQYLPNESSDDDSFDEEEDDD